MLVVVQQALGDIHGGNPQLFRFFGEGENELVAGAAIGVGGGAADGFQSLEQVVGCQGGELAHADHAFTAQRAGVVVGAQQYTGVAHEGTQVTNAGLQGVGVDPVVAAIVALARHGGGQVGQQPLGHTHRASTGAAAAVRGGKSLVQVHVDDIEAHVTGAYLAENGVEVGAIVIEQAAGFVDSFGYGFDLPFEHAAGAGVGHHQAGGLGATGGFQGFQIHVTIFTHRHFTDLVATHDGGGRVGAVGGFRDEDLGTAFITTGFVVGTDHGDPGELALGARHGGQRYAFHASDFLEEVLQLEHATEETLAVGLRGQGVAVQKARQHGGTVGTTGVVLHGAGAQRVELLVDGEVLAGQVGVMPHHLHFRHFRQGRLLFAAQVRRNGAEFVVCQRFRRLGDGTAAGLGQLENQLGLAHAARTSFRATANKSRSLSLWTSVALIRTALGMS